MHLPQHIAIILDGNGRWAKAKGLPRSYGHVVGCDNLEKMCHIIREMGIKYLTVFTFSTENWKRSLDEVRVLMNLFRRYLKRIGDDAKKFHMRVRVIGKRDGLAPDILKRIEELEELSKDYDDMHLQIALNYGSRDEIVRGVSKLAEDVKNGNISPDAIDENTFSSYLDTADVPDPDLLIRTSGEQRISNFLLWQIAYSELYFTDKPWPAFKKPELLEAIEEYNKRNRRFGGV